MSYTLCLFPASCAELQGMETLQKKCTQHYQDVGDKGRQRRSKASCANWRTTQHCQSLTTDQFVEEQTYGVVCLIH